jgi:hypothetical protein
MTEFIAVGMRFRGNHTFTREDSIILQEDNENPHDANAVNILVESDDGSLKHVAYVTRSDCLRIRDLISAGGASRTSASLIRHYPASARLQVNLP